MEHRGTHLKQLKRSKPSCCGKSGDIFTNWISFRSFSRLSTEARNFSFKSIFSLHAQIVSLRIMCLIIVPNPRAFVNDMFKPFRYSGRLPKRSTMSKQTINLLASFCDAMCMNLPNLQTLWCGLPGFETQTCGLHGCILHFAAGLLFGPPLYKCQQYCSGEIRAFYSTPFPLY